MLNTRGRRATERVLNIIAHDFPQLEYCPTLPGIACILCHYLLEEQVLDGMLTLIKKSMSVCWGYFPTHKQDFRMFCKLFEDLVKRKDATLHKTIAALHNERGKTIWDLWFRSMFIGYFPIPLVFRVMDSFLVEGYKALYRFGLAALMYHKPILVHLDNFEELVKLYNGNIPDPERLVALAMNVRVDAKVSRKNLSNQSLNEYEEPTDSGQHTYVSPNISVSEATINTLTSEEWSELWFWLPSRFRAQELYTLFSTRDDGYHLGTLISKTVKQEPLVFIFETDYGELFGCFLSSQLLKQEQDIRFSGTGETFLFSIRPTLKKYPWVGHAKDLSDEELLRINKECSFYFCCSNKDLIVGGGG
jgi:hypothetical protein